MEFSDEWTSLLLTRTASGSRNNSDSSSSSSSHIGPLIFNPAAPLTLLFSSPSLTPCLPPKYPKISLSRFLLTSSSLLPSTCSSVAADFGPQFSDSAADFHHNRLQFLQCPGGTRSVIVFFATGENCDRIGFLMLYVNKQDSNLNAVVVGDGGVSCTIKNFNHRIVNIVVTSVDSPSYGSSTTTISPETIGYLMACTYYGVHWFIVKLHEKKNSEPVKPLLDFVESCVFKTGVMHACWNPHFPEESLVLLESGDLFLFHFDSRGIVKEKLQLKWDSFASSLGNGGGGWLSCMFSWHPRVIVVAHSNAVFLVDLRSQECNVSILVKTDTFVMGAHNGGHFLAFSQAGSDGYCFAVGSDKRLLLCDVRRPLMPLLQWDHHIDNPCYINVFPLSELRSYPKDSCYNRANEAGYGIVMGSFWNNEFSLFCYGPPLCEAKVSSERVSKPAYAWGLPYCLPVSGRGCHCGDCILKEEFSKDALPEWIDWRQKKEIVLGFGILGKDLLHADPCGFTLIRLMSSGKLESQCYTASWESMNAHTESSPYSESCLIYATGGENYKLPKKFQYIKLNHLCDYMKGFTSKERHPTSGANLDQCLSEKAKAFGSSQRKMARSPHEAFNDVYENIGPLTSIHEFALTKLWSGLNKEHLKMAFCNSEHEQVLEDHMEVSSDLPVPVSKQSGRMPPFFYRVPSARGNKFLQKEKVSVNSDGPLVPCDILHTLGKAEVDNECNQVMQVLTETGKIPSGSDVCYVSQSPAQSCLLTKYSCNNEVKHSGDERFRTFISRPRPPEKEASLTSKEEILGSDFFDSLLPFEVKSEYMVIKAGPKELETAKMLKKQFSGFLQGSSSW